MSTSGSSSSSGTHFFQVMNSKTYSGENLRRIMHSGVAELLEKGSELDKIQKSNSAIIQFNNQAMWTASLLQEYHREAGRIASRLEREYENFDEAAKLIANKKKQLAHVAEHNLVDMSSEQKRIQKTLHNLRRKMAKVFGVPVDMLVPEQISLFKQYTESSGQPMVSSDIFRTDLVDVRQILAIPRADTHDEFDKTIVEARLREQASQVNEMKGRLEALTAEVREEDNTISGMRREREEMIIAQSARELEFITDKNVLQGTIDGLRTTLRNGGEERGRLERELDQKKQELDRKQQELTASKQELKSANEAAEARRVTDAEERQKERQEGDRLLTEMRDALAARQDRDSAETRWIGGTVERLLAGQREIAQMRQQLQYANAGKERAEQILKGAQAKVKELQESIFDMRQWSILEEGIKTGEARGREQLAQAEAERDEALANLEVVGRANDNLQIEVNRSIATSRAWTGKLLDTVIVDNDCIWTEEPDEHIQLFEDMLRQRGPDLRLSDIYGIAEAKHRKALIADEYVDYDTLPNKGPWVVRLLQLVFGDRAETQETLASLQWVEKCFMAILRERHRRSKANLLLIYIYLLRCVQKCQGVEFAMACSILANICTQFPITRQGQDLTDGLVSSALAENAAGHTDRDRLGRLCLLRLALSLRTEQSQEAVIDLAGFQVPHIRGLGLAWDTSIPEMIEALWTKDPKQADDWAFNGKAMDGLGQGVDLCIFRNLQHSTSLLLVRGHHGHELAAPTPRWIASSLKLVPVFDTREDLEENKKFLARYGHNELDHVIYWGPQVKWKAVVEKEDMVRFFMEKVAVTKDVKEIMEERTRAWMQQGFAEAGIDTTMSG